MNDDGWFVLSDYELGRMSQLLGEASSTWRITEWTFSPLAFEALIDKLRDAVVQRIKQELTK